MSRILFLFLLALNAAAGAWLYHHRPGPTSFPPASDEGVPALVLLSERNAEDMAAAAAAAEMAAAPQAMDAPPPPPCYSLGPFASAEALDRAMALLAPRVARNQYRETSAEITRGYWVYLPAYDSREAALKAARQLNAAGVRDYYVVTTGERQNTVSLGLFRDRENASRREQQISALGFPARLEERTEVERQFWLDYQENPDQAAEWEDLPGASRLDRQAMRCF